MKEEKARGNPMDIQAAAVALSLPRGRENAMSRGELARVFQVNDRAMRQLLEDARAHGFLVCNEQDGKGYYLAETLDEVERQYRRDYARAMSLLVRLKPMRRMLWQAGRLRKEDAKKRQEEMRREAQIALDLGGTL